MPTCPHCGSQSVYLSRAEDRPALRLLLLARVRCHECYECFYTPRWRAKRWPRATDAPGSKSGYKHKPHSRRQGRKTPQPEESS